MKSGKRDLSYPCAGENRDKGEWMMNQDLNYFKSRRGLWTGQFLLSGLGLAMAVWSLTDYFKSVLWGTRDFGLYPWTYIFFHPVEANLPNYFIICVFLGCMALVFYLLSYSRVSGRLDGNLEGTRLVLAWGSLVLSAILLGTVWFLFSPKIRVIISLGVACFPLLWLVPRFAALVLPQAPLIRYGCPLICGILLLWAGSEQLAFFRMPVSLMNEYADIYGETRIRGRFVENQAFLKNITEEDMKAIKLFLDLLPFLGYHSYPEVGEGNPFIPFRRFDLEPARGYLLTLTSKTITPGSDAQERYRELAASLQRSTYGGIISRERPPDSSQAASLLPRLERLDVEAIKDFYLANRYEHNHQNMGRGQINHIGHILNPLNEYELGKPLRDLYLQYGLGNTMLMKWIMDRFGGISLQNYYRTYFLYPLYFLLFLTMSFYLFRDWLYTLAAFSALPLCFLFMGYTAFVVAPGIVPSIHLLDAPAVAFFLWYLRSDRRLALAASLAAALMAIVLNSQFGLAIAASLSLALGFFALECKKGKQRFFLVLLLLVFLGASLGLLQAVRTGQMASIFPYFLTGLFSWPVRRSLVVLTLLYLVASYVFLLIFRNDRSEFKYVYIFVFAYSQATLLYFFWSGLVNHLPPVLPFLWLQLLLMLFMIQKALGKTDPVWSLRIYRAAAGLALLALFLLVPAGLIFYREKGAFLDNFIDHRVYRWPFERGTVVSTMPPGIFEESLALIQAYSTGQERGIYILSKYDGLLPFLAHRFSAMPFFELSGYLLSPREYRLALRTVKERRPEYLYVDTNIRRPGDSWNSLNVGDKGYALERASRLSRYELLGKLFEEVAADYEKIAEGKLISVYRRIPGR
jgi:hypothetical protein